MQGLITIPDAAEYLGVSARWVRTQTGLGELPTVRLGRRRLIRPEDLAAFVERRTSPAGTESARTGESA